MTDNEIIKALDWLVEQMGVCSSDDAYIYGHILLCHFNRQKAEIERLKANNAYLMLPQYARQTVVETAKAEAIKEFAERLKEELSFGKYIQPDQIDNLVKEMVGDGDG